MANGATRIFNFFTAILALFVILPFTMTRAFADDITVFVAKKIITMDKSWPEGSAVAVRGGKILAIGSLDDMKPWLDSGANKIDRTFAEKILLPGFIEPHGHPINASAVMTLPLLSASPVPNPYGPAFPGVKTRDEAITLLRGYVAKAKSPDETVLTWGYDPIVMGGGHLDKTVLDKISATQPIVMLDASEHFVYLNSAALKKYKITKEHTKVNGIMAGSDGEPNGKFLGANAMRVILVPAIAAQLKPDVASKNIRWLMDLSRKYGVTTTSDLAFGSIDVNLERSLIDKYFNDTASPMRVAQIADTTTLTAVKGEKEAIALVKGLMTKNGDRVMVTGAKFFADDAFLALSMQLISPGYIDGREGIWLTKPEKMVESWLPWWKSGFHFHVHSNGSAGNEATINALSKMMSTNPRFNHRFTIEHYGISTPEQARRLQSLGGSVSANPYFLYDRAEVTEPFIGADRSYTAVRLKTLVEAGIPTALHTDSPVGPPNPLEEVWIAVNRFGRSGKVRGPAERVSLDQALRMVTIDAAYVLGIDDKVGSIAAGKFADFAVLEQDPYEVPVEAIRDIKVWGTVSGGRIFPASEIRP